MRDRPRAVEFARRFRWSMVDEQGNCPDCGAPMGGRSGCDRAFHELGARAIADAAFGYGRRAVVDAYCLQHPAYIESLKSFAAHLCGLCAAVERRTDARAERAIWHTLQVPPGATKPPPVRTGWTRTVASVVGATEPMAFRQAVDTWVADVWSAWAAHHALARQWLDYAIEHPLPRKH